MFKHLDLCPSLSCNILPLATMDPPDVTIPETSNSSSTADDVITNVAPTEIMVFKDEMFANCTPLDGMDLVDVFTAVDIDNTEFWGSASVTWMTFFIMYYVLFYASLLVLICYCGYLLAHACFKTALIFASCLGLSTYFIHLLVCF